MLELKVTLKSIGSYYREKVSLIGFLNTLLNEPESIAKERRNRKELLKLFKLEEHVLMDMGLSKADIEYVLMLPLTKSSAKELNYARKRSSKI